MKIGYSLVLFCLIWQASWAFTCYDEINKSCAKEGEFSKYDSTKCTAEWGAFPRLESKTNELIALHLKHSMQYLLTANYFNKWDVNRPGFHAYFNKLADEEWDAAIAVTMHMLKRGGQLDDNFKVEVGTFQNQKSELQALSWALDTEKQTADKLLHLANSAIHVNHANSVSQVIPVPENENARDSEFADFLSERLSHITVLRVKHMANYVNMLAQIMTPPKGDGIVGIDKAFAMFTFDQQILK